VLGLAFVLVVAIIVGVVARVAPLSFASKQSSAWFGASYQSVVDATNAAQWPQAQSNWCGVASDVAIIEYDGVTTTQSNLANFLDSSAAVSAWGEPPHSSGYYGPGFAADISGDFGSDPRSLAEGLMSQTNQGYHQLIDEINAYDATMQLSRDVARSKQPITVFVDHGQHSVLVSAVQSTRDPVLDPSTVTTLQVWDPGFGTPGSGIQNAREENVSLNDWLTNTIYWGLPYQSNPYKGLPFDPNPAIGPYAYNTSESEYLSLWINHYVYIRPDITGSASASVNADWAFDQSGALIIGQQGQVPAGYTGPTSATPIQSVNSGQFSTTAPGLWTDATDPAPSSSAPHAAVAWVGTNGSHSLNVMLSTNGLNYGSKITLSQSSDISPAVLVNWVNNQAVVTIAWVGTSSSQSLYVLHDVYGALGTPQELTLSTQSSNAAPTLAEFGNQIWLAWTAPDASHTLHVMSLGANGVTPGADTALTGVPGSGAGPRLVTDTQDNDLWLVYQEQTTRKIDIVSSTDGVSWQRALGLPVVWTTNDSPGAVVIPSPPNGESPYYVAWANTTTNTVELMGSSTVTHWGPLPTSLAANGAHSVAIGSIGAPHLLVIAWTNLGGGSNGAVNFETVQD
jgi:hypothetical protein